MEQKDTTGIVPPQYTGKEISVQSSTEFQIDHEAKQFFDVAKERLFDVNNWHNIVQGITANFQVVNAAGKEIKREVQKGDYLRIDIPGPGSMAGHGYDWVHVEDVKEVAEDSLQSIGFRVRPSENPLGDQENTAHFYDHSATSNFIVTREGNKVIALVIEKNLKPNLDTDSLTDKIRDATVGTTALMGLSRIQWQNLVDGIVKIVFV